MLKGFDELREPEGAEKVVTQRPEYLSPSAFKIWRRCPEEYYLKKLSPHKKKIERRPQGIAACVGNAFDSFVKAQIMKDNGTSDKSPYDFINATVQNKTHIREATQAGMRLFGVYLATAWDYLMEEEPTRCDHKFDKVMFRTVPILGFVDCFINSTTVLDWKTRGYRTSPRSPMPGWRHKWANGKLVNKSHKRCDDPFETIDESWALQVAMYAFADGHEVGGYLPVAIDELSMRRVVNPESVNVDNVCVTQIRSEISQSFQLQLAEDLERAWDQITRGDIPTVSACKARCYRFRMLCEASPFCDTYQKNSIFILGKRHPSVRPSADSGVDTPSRLEKLKELVQNQNQWQGGNNTPKKGRKAR